MLNLFELEEMDGQALNPTNANQGHLLKSTPPKLKYGFPMKTAPPPVPAHWYGH